MAKNLKTRLKNFIESMNTEEKKADMNEENDVHTEPALTDAHNPDLGTPEEPALEEQPQNVTEKWQKEAAECKDK